MALLHSEFIIQHSAFPLAPGTQHPAPIRIRVDFFSRNSYHLSMKTTVSEKGQITIPKPLRLRLGIKPRQVLNVREDRGRLVLAKSDARDPVDAVFGIPDLHRPTDQLIASLGGAKDDS